MSIRKYITIIESQKFITREELLSRYPEIEADLSDVDDWMNNKPVYYKLVIEPTSKFADEAEAMLNTYEEFPKDERRTKKIVSLLKSGAKQLPIFCDSEGFIMERRHRFVAFYLLTIPTMPVIYVTEQ